LPPNPIQFQFQPPELQATCSVTPNAQQQQEQQQEQQQDKNHLVNHLLI
jgi:hypothetical protein